MDAAVGTVSIIKDKPFATIMPCLRSTPQDLAHERAPTSPDTTLGNVVKWPYVVVANVV